MIFKIENLPVYFPYDHIYPEQYEYMKELKRALDEKGHCLLQMPPGTGKTIALLSLITSYNLSKPQFPIKLVYCTPTAHEMEKTLNELRLLYNYQGKYLDTEAYRYYCPDYLARGMVQFANVVVCTYRYMLEPKVAGIISEELQRDTVVVFDDEAHNLDNVCIEALSVRVSSQTLEQATSDIDVIRKRLFEATTDAAGRLLAEYNRLRDDEAVPGNIRKAHHFLHFLQRLVRYLQGRLGSSTVETTERPVVFLSSILNKAVIDQNSMRFCYHRLRSLVLTLAIHEDELSHIQTLCSLAALIATSGNAGGGGFSVIVERDVLHLCCLDASLAMKPVFDRFQSVVITSGTLSSPIGNRLYPRLLKFNPVVSRSFTISTGRDCICPMVVSTLGSHDQAQNYGKLLVEMVSVVPDGIVCFFENYSHMDGIINTWNGTGILKEVMQNKLVFVETQDVVETTLAVENYRRACDRGRGAVFLSVSGGKVARGIDFNQHYGRLILLFGVPHTATTSSRILRARLEFLRDKLQINEEEFHSYDAARQAGQCVGLGRVLRSKADYGVMVFAGKGYCRCKTRSKLLPGWILSHLSDAQLNLSPEMALHVVRNFLGRMAHPHCHDRKTLLSLEDLGDDQMIDCCDQ